MTKNRIVLSGKTSISIKNDKTNIKGESERTRVPPWETNLIQVVVKVNIKVLVANIIAKYRQGNYNSIYLE